MSQIEISLVVPVWNEEENIKPFVNEVKKYLSSNSFEIIFVCDPSSDNTEEIINELASKDKKIKLLLMSRKFGQPMAILAGLTHSKGDCAIILDVDLQDPPSLIPEMISNWRKGFEVILPQRKSRVEKTQLDY